MKILQEKINYEHGIIDFEQFKQEALKIHAELIRVFQNDFQENIDSLLNFEGIDVF